RIETADQEGRTSTVVLSAGAVLGNQAPKPPPQSWASDPDGHVRIYTVALEPGAEFTLPAANDPSVLRTLYFFSGSELSVDGHSLFVKHGVDYSTPGASVLVNGSVPAEVLVLEGKPIGEPVAHYGPFVMNTREELQQAVTDYQSTQFGGWPWESDEPVHARARGRFARHADGRVEEKA
ncbi:MAG: pirin-like C-terminal cupin domain-containing protein, partial [Myxococcota bacterium]